MPARPRLRDAGRLTSHDLYPLNVFPEEIVRKIGGYLVYLIYIGRKDILEGDYVTLYRADDFFEWRAKNG